MQPPPKLKVTRSLRRVVREVFPDFDEKEALRLLEMGLLHIPKKLRCGAYARSTCKPCKAQAIPGRAPKSEQGRQNIREADAQMG